jgi:hypothetical protein
MAEHKVSFSQSSSEYLKNENILNNNPIIGAINFKCTKNKIVCI